MGTVQKQFTVAGDRLEPREGGIRLEREEEKSNKLKNHSSAGNGIYYSEIKMSQGVHVSTRLRKMFFSIIITARH